MKINYIVFGVLFVGLIFAAAYILPSKNVRDDSDMITTTTQSMAELFSLTSSAFEPNGRIPSKYTCDGDKTINPPLEFSGIPEGAKSLVLIMDDPDVPKMLRPDGVFDHWVVFNIPPDAKGIAENETVGTAGANGAGARAYTGPCPPPQYEPSEHRYVFKLYALSAMLNLETGAAKKEVLDALAPVKIAEAELIGRYSRK